MINQNNPHYAQGPADNNSMQAAKNQVTGCRAVHDSASQMHQDTFNVTPKNIAVSNLDGGQNSAMKLDQKKKEEEEEEEELKIPILFNNFEGFKDIELKK